MTPPTAKSVLGSWLRELREAAKLSQQQAGQAVGVDAREIRRWEKGEAPGGLVLLRLLTTYGVRIEPSPPLPGSVNAELQELRGSIQHRLAALEDTVEQRGSDVTTALKALDAGIRRLERRLDAGDPPASQPGRTR